MPKHRCQQQCRTSVWFYLLAGAFGLMVVLSACGGGNVANATPGSTPTTVAHTPTTPPTSTSSATPTLVPGLTQVVLITNESNGSFGFSPTALTIKVGATVIWKNVSSVTHTVTSDDGQTFDSGNIPSGGTFRFTFTTAGTLHYHCNIHPYMRATISPV